MKLLMPVFWITAGFAVGNIGSRIIVGELSYWWGLAVLGIIVLYTIVYIKWIGGKL